MEQLINTEPIYRSVRFIYLVSADRSLNINYSKGIVTAAISIKKWYKDQMNGLSFILNNPIVEVIKSNKDASFFYSNPIDCHSNDDWGFYNTRNEIARIFGADFNCENYVWVIFSDGPGNKGRGCKGVCILPEDDLLGLVGMHPEQKDINRWIGGMGHELGHAFGLQHPNDTTRDYKALMYAGFYNQYPNETYLTSEDKILLRKSTFFIFDQQSKIIITYIDGWFECDKNFKLYWKEIKNNETSIIHDFDMYKEDDSYYCLRRVDVELLVKLPKEKGISVISTNKGQTWSNWYEMELNNS